MGAFGNSITIQCSNTYTRRLKGSKPKYLELKLIRILLILKSICTLIYNARKGKGVSVKHTMPEKQKAVVRNMGQWEIMQFQLRLQIACGMTDSQAAEYIAQAFKKEAANA